MANEPTFIIEEERAEDLECLEHLFQAIKSAEEVLRNLARNAYGLRLQDTGGRLESAADALEGITGGDYSTSELVGEIYRLESS